MRIDRVPRWLYPAGWLISAGVMGVTFRMWQLHVREVEERAERAVRAKDEAAKRTAMEERLRIARELHDSLTHSISVIQVQAGVAVHLANKRGEDVPPALLAIQEAGADAARELRATLQVLRTEDGDGSGLCQLDGLLARHRAAGLPVTVTVTGHVGHARATVRLHYAPGALTVHVDDDGSGSGATAPGPGLGLIGMRERVSVLGGRLHSGPRDGGGFQVRAELPLPAS